MQKKARPAICGISIQLSVLTVFFVFGLGLAKGQDKTDRKVDHLKKKCFVIAHRGAAGLAPENTLAAFKRALNLGVDAVELDVQLSADGSVVVYHDFTLNPDITRTADGKWLDMWTGLLIKNLSVAELKRYDVGRLDPYSAYARQFPDQVPMDGERIPTLGEVIALLRGQHEKKTKLWIEIKTSPEDGNVSSPPEAVAQKVVDLLIRENFTHRSSILSFDWLALGQVRKMAPDIQTVYLSTTSFRFDTIQKGRSGISPWTAGVDVDDFDGSIPRMINALGGRYWAPRHNQISPDLVEEAHRFDMGVFVWTVDSERDMKRLIEMGVDGIITNRPDNLRSVLANG